MWSALSTQHSALSTQHSALSTQHSALSTQHYTLKRLTKSFFLSLFAILILTGIASAAPNSCFIYSIDDPASGFNEWASTRQEACQKYYKFVKPLDPDIIFYEGTIIRISDGGEMWTPLADYEYGVSYCGIKFASIKYPSVYYYGFPKFTKMDFGSCGQTLTLTPAPNQKDPRPKGTEGKDGKDDKSTYELIAKVMEGSTPKAGVAVTFKVDVVPMTGGHGHHDASRSKGEVTPNGKTDSNGEIKLTFQVSDVAGSHTITAICNDCTNKTVNKNVDVRVPDLQPLSPNPPQNAEGKYLYALTANDPKHVGTSGGRQKGEYYLTAKAIDNLQVLVTNFATENWGIVAFNDASLVWGGLYDIDNDWMESHQGHRVGEEIDISFTRANNPISEEKRKRVYKTLCDDKKTSVPFKILYHIGGKGPHYHVYLMGRKNGCFTLPT